MHSVLKTHNNTYGNDCNQKGSYLLREGALYVMPLKKGPFPTVVCQLNINSGRCWKARQIGVAIKIGIPFF